MSWPFAPDPSRQLAHLFAPSSKILVDVAYRLVIIQVVNHSDQLVRYAFVVRRLLEVGSVRD